MNLLWKSLLCCLAFMVPENKTLPRDTTTQLYCNTYERWPWPARQNMHKETLRGLEWLWQPTAISLELTPARWEDLRKDFTAAILLDQRIIHHYILNLILLPADKRSGYLPSSKKPLWTANRDNTENHNATQCRDPHISITAPTPLA